jgi:hypothetical protein
MCTIALDTFRPKSIRMRLTPNVTVEHLCHPLSSIQFHYSLRSI